MTRDIPCTGQMLQELSYERLATSKAITRFIYDTPSVINVPSLLHTASINDVESVRCGDK